MISRCVRGMAWRGQSLRLGDGAATGESIPVSREGGGEGRAAATGDNTITGLINDFSSDRPEVTIDRVSIKAGR